MLTNRSNAVVLRDALAATALLATAVTGLTAALAPSVAHAAGPRVIVQTTESGKSPSGIEVRLLERLVADGFVLVKATLPKTPPDAAAIGKLGGLADFVVAGDVSGKDEERTAFGVTVFAYPASARLALFAVATPSSAPIPLAADADRPASDAGAARAASYRILADSVYPALRAAALGGPVSKVLHLDVAGLPGTAAAEALLAALGRVPGVMLARVRYADAERTRVDIEVRDGITAAAIAAALGADPRVGVEVTKVAKDELDGRYVLVDGAAIAVAVGRFSSTVPDAPGAAGAAPLMPDALRIALKNSVYLKPVGGDRLDKAFGAGGGSKWLVALREAGAAVAVTGTIDPAPAAPGYLEIVATVWDTRGAIAIGTVRVTVPSWAALSGALPLSEEIEKAVFAKAPLIAPGVWYDGTPYVRSLDVRARAVISPVKIGLAGLGGPTPAGVPPAPPPKSGDAGAPFSRGPLGLFPSFPAWHAANPAMTVTVRNLGPGASGELTVRLIVEGLGPVAEAGVRSVAAKKSADVDLRYLVDPDALARHGTLRAAVLTGRLEISWADAAALKKEKAAAKAAAKGDPAAAPVAAASEGSGAPPPWMRLFTVWLPFVVHSRNDRPTESVVAFVTPSDPTVVAFARAASDPATSDPALARLAPPLRLPAALWNSLAAIGLRTREAKLSDDPASRLVPVRLPAETLVAKDGTDLDVAVLYAALLEASGLRAHLVPGAAGVAVAVDVGPAFAAAHVGAGAYPVSRDARGRALVVLDPRKLADGFEAAWRHGLERGAKVDAKTGVVETEWVAVAWGATPPLATPPESAVAPVPDRSRVAKLDKALGDGWGAAADGRAAAATALVDKRYPAGDPDPDHLVALGRVAAEAGNWPRAMDLFRRALELAPAHAGAHLGVAREALGRGDLDATIAAAETALASKPPLATAREASLVAALARAGKGDPGSARKLLLKGGALGADMLPLLGLGEPPPATGPRKGRAVKGAAVPLARGLKAYAEGAAAAATAEFRSAYDAALAAGPAGAEAAAAASFNLAHALWLGGDLTGAAHHFRVYLRVSKKLPPDTDEVERIARALATAAPGSGAYVRELWVRPSVQLAPALAAALPW